jgi:hypothetical protein
MNIKTLYMTLEVDKNGPYAGKEVLRIWDGKDIMKYLYEAPIDKRYWDLFHEFLENYLKK